MKHSASLPPPFLLPMRRRCGVYLQRTSWQVYAINVKSITNAIHQPKGVDISCQKKTGRM